MRHHEPIHLSFAQNIWATLKPYEVGLWHNSQRCNWTKQRTKLESEFNEETQKAISLFCACLCQALREHVIEVNSEYCKKTMED